MIFAIMLCCVLFCNNTFAEKEPQFTTINIRMRDGRPNGNNEPATYEHVFIKIDTKAKSLSVSCFSPGDKECPVKLTILMTVVTGISERDMGTQTNMSLTTALDYMKKQIALGQECGRFVQDNMLYSWQDGSLTDAGVFNFNLSAVEYSKIIR